MCVQLITDLLAFLNEWSSLIGVSFAIYAYLRWKNNFKAQKAHEYAIELLKRIKHLQYEIEYLGNARIISKNLKKEFKMIEEHISNHVNPLFIDIRVDLLIAEKFYFGTMTCQHDLMLGLRKKL